MRAQHHRAWILRAETLLEEARPHPAARAQLGNLFKKIAMQIPEEGETRGEVIDVDTAIDGVLHITEAIGDREGEFLHRSRAGLANVIAGNRHWMKARCLLGAELDHVGDDAQRWRGRANPFLLRGEFLEHIVLNRSA